jgi:hypothetical protein
MYGQLAFTGASIIVTAAIGAGAAIFGFIAQRLAKRST